MGEVYRARDTRLDRIVALKLLRAGATDDPQAQPRFLREARAVAALKHPNIVSVYSVEETAGRTFITMELIDGEPLSDLIPGTGLELARLRQIALQLAAALTSAHPSGVTHRDLKPANVMIERNSTVKVLDFGLAKMNKTTLLADTTQLSSDIATQAGVIMGTVPYMSPEQIQGRAVDQRTDIFSLGVILYEMATGKRPFRGGTSADIAASILRDEPERISAQRPDLPTSLERIIGRCLVKDPTGRFLSAAAVQRELEILPREL